MLYIGRGVPQDYVHAHMWSISQPQAVTLKLPGGRDGVAKLMSAPLCINAVLSLRSES
jgi:hypothetical protein